MKNTLVSLSLLLCLGLTACETDTTTTDVVVADTTMMTNTIVDVAQSDDQFSTLVTALQAADLVNALQDDGPFTVFAPTNAAFAKLGSQVDSLLLPKNQEQLRAILLYHVASGEVMAADVTGMTNITTLQGGMIPVSATNGTVMLGNSATVTGTDFDASNGVIHVIDTVLMPNTDM